MVFFSIKFCLLNFEIYICSPKRGAIAQSVEQWTENPCVPGSIPGGTTSLKRKTRKINVLRVFVLKGVTESVEKTVKLTTQSQIKKTT